jgi:hypothetical protein
VQQCYIGGVFQPAVNVERLKSNTYNDDLVSHENDLATSLPIEKNRVYAPSYGWTVLRLLLILIYPFHAGKYTTTSLKNMKGSVQKYILDISYLSNSRRISL